MSWPSRVSTRFENVSVHPTAEIAEDVEIGPFTVIGPNCRIARGNYINNNVTLYGNVDLGEGNEIYPGTVIGGLPQDKKYAGEYSQVILGARNVIRENVTINSGTKIGNGLTRLGNNNLIMAGCHIAHDCILQDDITMANNVLLGGHILVERGASFGGLAAVHHFVTIGRQSFVGGLTRVAQDVPPYMLVEGNPSKVWSINKVGLKRRNVPDDTIYALKTAHRQLFRSTRPRASVIDELLTQSVPELRYLVEFVLSTESGANGRARQPVSDTPPPVWHQFPVRW